MPLQKNSTRFAIVLALVAWILHILLFDWMTASTYYSEEKPFNDPSIFYNFGNTLDSSVLFVLYDFSYGIFPGAPLLYMLIGVALPAILILTAVLVAWNAQKSNQEPTKSASNSTNEAS
jgi:hypothetical protein